MTRQPPADRRTLHLARRIASIASAVHASCYAALSERLLRTISP